MPPRGKMTEEQKEAAFEAWKQTGEWTAIMAFQAEYEKLNGRKKGGLELSDVDLSIDIQEYLNALFLLV